MGGGRWRKVVRAFGGGMVERTRCGVGEEKRWWDHRVCSGGYERRALFGNNADTRLHPHLHSSP